ncbi:YdgA family protein [Pseudomonas guariconensis]|uniref:YdgA family protein n=1 Tax=Pseudomonas TaxID=286 RepID=UPI0020986662|nr:MULTISPECIES: YdgA family protein [Pseudomonas]MCO7640274.1 YdgA family protein [Pseudomonas sp. S 311-6]MCO7513628.1 YdgA family protein [Pseudomonas putida]MCO7565534.1 YdgA family protein [Pseudomonas mosselii]MCO7593214.1 YdgA family protein [Pseudomonas guariconensis]MCO7606199.1 YdgA family protein [Pseudomonas guariconensis]
MKKSVGILSGLAVVIAVATTAGAWYTGTHLPAELERSVARGNEQLQKTMAGTGGSMTLELASLEQRFFTSTAHYRLKAKDVWLGEGEPLNFDLGIVDQIEHGPFPWSRIKALKLMPVMATSNSVLEKDDFTAAWFTAAGDKTPLAGQVSLGYGGGIESDIRLAPLKLSEENGSTLDFSGMQLLLRGDRDGKVVKIDGHADRLEMNLAGDEHPPIKFLLNGFKVDGDLAGIGHDMIYVGNLDLALAETQVTLGPQQDVLVLKGLEQNNRYDAEGQDKLSGRLEYKVADITYAGRAVGSGEMVWTMKSLDIPAMQALLAWYQTKMPQVQQAAAQGEPLPSLDMTAQEQAKVQADLQKMLAAKPQLALENLSFKTANGESRFNLAVDLASPTSFDLPPEQLGKQLVTRLQGKLTLSKPMIGDLATLQALLEGQTDAQFIARQSSQAGEMVGMMALQSGMATVEGDDVVSSLHYADGMVDFNGRKMTVEEFAMLLNAHLAALAPQG